MAIDAECETPIVKARGIGKGKKKALDCSRNAEIDRNNVGDVLCFDKTNFIVDTEPGDSSKKVSLRSADAFPFFASLPIFRKERSDDRKCVCASQATKKSESSHLRDWGKTLQRT